MTPPSISGPVFSLMDVSKRFGGGTEKAGALNHITFEARSGELVVLLGPSGSGKTTLLTIVAGLLEPTEGMVSLFGRPICSYSKSELQSLRATRIGFVFQTFLLVDALTVQENVALVAQFGGCTSSEAKHKARNVLASLHIGYLTARFPSTLSQGEKQRVAVARAIVNKAGLLLADEPTANVESTQGMHIIKLFREYAQDRKACVIVASHDLRIVEFADRVLRIQDGCLFDNSMTIQR